ncbi:MAG: putative sulfate exporter family transporter [Muribaculaceae bacterium]|nr:putative sulfate exporter family transporter [Muribaculaceae bacterium]
MIKTGKFIYIALIILVLFPYNLIPQLPNIITPAVALLIGIVYAIIFKCPYPKFNKKTSKYLLQASVVGLGFGMNVNESLRSGAEGMMFTIISVVGVMTMGVLIGYWLHLNRKTSYLIASGTAICGGSAIAAVGPVLKANDQEMAVSLGVIFILNAIALFIFPPIGHFFDMTQEQFGTWAAIAIHDTSSVVGAGEAYGPQALQLATLIKLTRALWIIPLALVTMLIFRDKSSKISIPWFIFLFIIAMVLNTYCNLPSELTQALVWIAKKGLVLTLFLIGASLSITAIKSVGIKPLLLAILLWLIIGISSFIVVINTI